MTLFKLNFVKCLWIKLVPVFTHCTTVTNSHSLNRLSCSIFFNNKKAKKCRLSCCQETGKCKLLCPEDFSMLTLKKKKLKLYPRLCQYSLFLSLSLPLSPRIPSPDLWKTVLFCHSAIVRAVIIDDKSYL